MEEKYKIIGIYYTKPKITYDSGGEVIMGRIGVWLDVGSFGEFNGIGQKKVLSIDYDATLNSFRITYDKGGLRVIPMLPDTEITYELKGKK